MPQKVVPCFFHEDRASVTRCITCGKALCSDCANTFDGEVYCSAKCAESAVKFRQHAQDLEELDAVYNKNESASNVQGLIIKIILFIVLLIVGLVVWHVYVPADFRARVVSSIPGWCSFLRAFL